MKADFVVLAYHHILPPVRLVPRGLEKDEATEYQERLLEDMSRIERVAVSMGAERRIWSVDVTDRITEGICRLRLRELLREGERRETVA